MAQYVLLVDEVGMALMQNVFKGMNFLPVEGFTVDSLPKHYALATPKPEEAKTVELPVSDVLKSEGEG